MLRATTACTFSTSQLPKVVREWCALYILTSTCASRHNGMQFFISHLARWLRTRRFSEPTFRPSGATNYRKSTVIHDFSIFLRICIFFLLTLSLLRSSLFYSSLLSDSSHLCFSSVHIVGTLTSKLPSVTIRGCLISLWETSVNHCRKLPSSALGSEIVSGSNLYNMCVYIYIYLSIYMYMYIYISTKKNVLESGALGAYIHRARNAWES